MPVLSFIVERYEQKQGWYYITFRVELSETVRRLQEPSIITNAVTWKTRSTATFNARAYSLMEGTWQILDSVTETILAMHNEQDNAR